MNVTVDPSQNTSENRLDRPRIGPVGLALAPAALLVAFLLARLAVPTPRATPLPRAPTPVAPTPELALAAPTPIPTATVALPSPTPTVDLTELARLAAPTASPTPPPPTATATPAPPRFYTRNGVYRRVDGPISLIIPKIGVNAPVESVGVDPTGAMATPTTAFRVGWFDGGPVPGQPGNAVIDGHLDSRVYGAAVFWYLYKLGPGDKVEVTMPSQRTLTFVVERVEVYPYNKAPLEDIFGPASTPHLNLITCSGVFDRASDNYNLRRVVYTRLASG